MQIYLLQHMLGSSFGHWDDETVGWLMAAREAGIGLKVFASQSIKPDMAKRLGARGVYALTREIIDRFGVPSRYAKTPDPHCQHLIDFMSASESFRRACRAIEAEGIGAQDLLAVPFATINHVHGVALWLESVPVARRPVVLFNFVEPHEAWRIQDDRDGIKGDFALSRYAGLRLRSTQPAQRILFTAADPRLCALVREALGISCHLAPVLMHYGQAALPASPAPPDADEGLRIGVMGDFRQEKGREHVIAALRSFVQQRPGSRVFVQVRNEEEAASVRSGLLAHDPDLKLKVQVGPMPRQQYMTQLQRSDLIVLPYDWKRYAIRTSGVFAEAAACGVPVVAPANTWMSDQLEVGHGAGEIFTEWSPAAIAAAMVKAYDRIGEFKQRAKSNSETWRQNQSIRAYLARVMDLCRAATGG